MKAPISISAFVTCSLLTLSGSVSLAQVWTEIPDAPDGVPASQETVGIGPLFNISGVTDDVQADFVDTFAIIITEPLAFYATTELFFGLGTGTATFDTRLFLWTEAGTPLLGNDDWSGGVPFHSLITDPSVFPGTVQPEAAGIALQPGPHLLSITGFENDPIDAGGAELLGTTGANLTPFTTLQGPNPAAGPFASWESAGGTTTETGSYVIELGGAMFRRPSCDFTSDSACDIDDLNALLAEGPIWPGVPVIPGVNDQFDLTGDGVIDLADQAEWLAQAATENELASPYKQGDANLNGDVDGIDFSLWNANKFTSTLLWDDGNFNGDAATDGSDFSFWNANKFTSSNAVGSVPEPTCAGLFVAVIVTNALAARKRW